MVEYKCLINTPKLTMSRIALFIPSIILSLICWRCFLNGWITATESWTYGDLSYRYLVALVITLPIFATYHIWWLVIKKNTKFVFTAGIVASIIIILITSSLVGIIYTLRTTTIVIENHSSNTSLDSDLDRFRDQFRDELFTKKAPAFSELFTKRIEITSAEIKGSENSTCIWGTFTVNLYTYFDKVLQKNITFVTRLPDCFGLQQKQYSAIAAYLSP